MYQICVVGVTREPYIFIHDTISHSHTAITNGVGFRYFLRAIPGCSDVEFLTRICSAVIWLCIRIVGWVWWRFPIKTARDTNNDYGIKSEKRGREKKWFFDMYVCVGEAYMTGPVSISSGSGR